jgi:hypothetical protein
MAQRIVAMLTELRYCLGVLAQTPILVDTGQYQAKYQTRTYQDMENHIARDLANAPNWGKIGIRVFFPEKELCIEITKG